MRTQHQISACCKYIRAIRNDAKRAYATAYFNWIRGTELEPDSSTFKLSAMGAQAVRLQIDEMMKDPA